MARQQTDLSLQREQTMGRNYRHNRSVLKCVSWYIVTCFVLHCISFFQPCAGLALDSDRALRQAILEGLTPEERHLFFGDLSDPKFHLVTPVFEPVDNSENSEAWRLVISSPDLFIDALVSPVPDLVSSHLEVGIYIDGEYVSVPALATHCHFRITNDSYVVTVSTCEGDGVDGIIVTPKELAILHPLPRRLHHLLPPGKNETENQVDEYGPHIFHITNKEKLPFNPRIRRDTEQSDEDNILGTCATGSAHDMREPEEKRRTVRRAPLFRDISELTGDIDLQEDLDRFRAPEDEEKDEEVESGAAVQAITRKKTVELAVFCDDVLYNNFPRRMKNKQASVMNYALTLVNAVQGIYHQEELQGYALDLQVVRLDILTGGNGPSKSGGDIGAYLKTFCSWQMAQNPAGESNPRHWDHAFMLSGMDLHSSGNTGVIGLAWVGGMCRPSISCTMNEGRSFMSVYVVAHEMGHNLGMSHDGHSNSGSCSSSKYIMSPSVGPGKTTWSQCSVRVLHSFLKRSSCLDDGGRSSLPVPSVITEKLTRRQDVLAQSAVLEQTPGRNFSPTHQCEAMFGRDYYPAITKFDLCNYMYCTNGIVTKPAHPALEGSICGQGRVCFAGKCRPELELIKHMISYAGVNPTQVGGPTPTTTYRPIDTDSTDSAEKNCTCDMLPQVPPSLLNLPKSICPFLAPVFHPLFNCTVHCPTYTLHVNLDTGSIKEVFTEDTYLPAGGNCFLGSYTVIQEKMEEDIRIPWSDTQVCSALPYVMHPTLQCPSVNALGEEFCPPKKIVASHGNTNYTYVQRKGNAKGKNLLWRGEKYILQDPTGEDISVRNVFASLPDTPESIGKYGFIRCNLEDDFPKELENLPKEICGFLAPVLHDLFNCSPEPQCVEYVIFMNLEDGNTTKVPVKKPTVELPPCKHCRSGLDSLGTVIWEIITGVTGVISQATGLCDVMPSLLLNFIPGCSQEQSLQEVSENCPPVSIVIQTGSTVFTYFPATGNKELDASRPSIKWQNLLYALHQISYNEDPTDALTGKYDLEFRAAFSSATPSMSPAMSVNSKDKKEDNVLSSNSSTTEMARNESGLGLQEYVAQNDVFLALNAPSAMLRTVVGTCSATCGRGTRPVTQECVDVHTEEVLDPSLCQAYSHSVTKYEECDMPPCGQARFEVEDWSACSKSCGAGVQYRRVVCVLNIEDEARQENLNFNARVVLVVDDEKCAGVKPLHIRECEGTCIPEPWCENKDDCFNYDDVEISKDFDY